MNIKINSIRLNNGVDKVTIHTVNKDSELELLRSKIEALTGYKVNFEYEECQEEQ